MTWESWILRTGGLMSPRECEELAAWAGNADYGDALEVGHYTGCSTGVLLSALPPDVQLLTIDDHRWRNIPEQTFRENVQPFIGKRTVIVSVRDYETALAEHDGTFGFVFYDGPHSTDDCERFWRAIESKLESRCLFLFDDADWPSMSRMGDMLDAGGFRRLNRFPLHRATIGYSTGDQQFDLDLAKRHPDTYTLDVWERL
jgi:predicted O-methyltransferase YrrM